MVQRFRSPSPGVNGGQNTDDPRARKQPRDPPSPVADRRQHAGRRGHRARARSRATKYHPAMLTQPPRACRVAFGTGGTPQRVIGWKSDVDLSSDTLRHYCGQVRASLHVTGAERGLIVALTTGTVILVMPPSSAKA